MCKLATICEKCRTTEVTTVARVCRNPDSSGQPCTNKPIRVDKDDFKREGYTPQSQRSPLLCRHCRNEYEQGDAYDKRRNTKPDCPKIAELAARKSSSKSLPKISEGVSYPSPRSSHSTQSSYHVKHPPFRGHPSLANYGQSTASNVLPAPSAPEERHRPRESTGRPPASTAQPAPRNYPEYPHKPMIPELPEAARLDIRRFAQAHAIAAAKAIPGRSGFSAANFQGPAYPRTLQEMRDSSHASGAQRRAYPPQPMMAHASSSLHAGPSNSSRAGPSNSSRAGLSSVSHAGPSSHERSSSRPEILARVRSKPRAESPIYISDSPPPREDSPPVIEYFSEGPSRASSRAPSVPYEARPPPEFPHNYPTRDNVW